MRMSLISPLVSKDCNPGQDTHILGTVCHDCLIMSNLLNAIVAMDLYISITVWLVFIVSPNMLNSRHLWVTKKKWVTADKELSFSSIHTRTDEWARRASWVYMSKPPHFWWLVYSWWANQLDSPLGTYKLITFRQLCQATAMPKHESVLACA